MAMIVLDDPMFDLIERWRLGSSDRADATISDFGQSTRRAQQNPSAPGLQDLPDIHIGQSLGLGEIDYPFRESRKTPLPPVPPQRMPSRVQQRDQISSFGRPLATV